MLDQAQAESIKAQLLETTAELRDVRARQQQLAARNVLLERLADLKTNKHSQDRLDWGVRFA